MRVGDQDTRMLNELKTAVTAFIRNISQIDLQKVFANKIKQVQACIDARGHHFQHFCKCTATFRTYCIINTTLLALCNSDTFHPANVHIQGVRQIHFNSKVDNMCNRCKIQFSEQGVLFCEA
jgi:hypothetical protein